MKRVFAFLFLTVFLMSGAGAAESASSGDFATGEDWTSRMSPREKFMSLVPPALLFSDYDVYLRLSLPRYLFLIDHVMERNPHLLNEDVESIFASTVYFAEPENRDALRRMEMNFLKGDFETPPSAPRLTIEDILREASTEA